MACIIDIEDEYNELLNAVKSGNNVLLHSPAGFGKTTLTKRLVQELRHEGWTCAVTALTGIAALNLGGSTLHSWAGIGLGKEDASRLAAKVGKSGPAAKRWLMTKVLIIDEISMMSDELFEKLDEVGRFVRCNGDTFGGLKILASGDFLQLPPVSGNWVFSSDLWGKMDWIPIQPMKPLRFIDPDYTELLMRIRTGTHTKKDTELLKSRVLPPVAKDGIIPTRIFPLRKEADDVNTIELKKIKAPEHEYVAFDEYFAAVADKALDELAPLHLVLKVGAQVMLRFNADIERGLVNGSRGVVLDTTDESVMVQFANGIKKELHPHTWSITNQRGDNIATRTQIPLILAWACSTHKAQGVTLDSAVCALGKSVFADGQAYVALSRVRSSDGLYLTEFDPKCIKANKAAVKYVSTLMEK